MLPEAHKPFRRLISGGAMGADFNTSSVLSDDFKNGLIKFSWAGYDGTNGKAVVQVSDDDTSWSDIGEGDTSFTISGATGSVVWEIWSIQGGYYRINFTEGDGTAGTATVSFRLKRRSNG